ncbi:MAG: signal peptidase I [Acidobacteriota bacterium]|jgi:signal peptidase I
MTDHPKSALRDYAETIAIFAIFILFSRCFVFQQSKIPTGSMKDTLLIGDFILVNTFIFRDAPTSFERALLPVRPIERGDVVVFRFPPQPEVDYIKRVIGLPGEEVRLIDSIVYIDGVPLEEPYVKHVDPPGRRLDANFGPVRVPLGHYFCMGDNRDQSADSRRWGFVEDSLIKGRAFLIWYSFEEDEDAYLRTGLWDRIGAVTAKIVHFFDRTRWSRLGRFIR